MTSALVTFQNEWRIYQVDDYEISELFIKNKIICNTDETSLIYAVFMEDSSDANILCSNFLKKEIYGSVIFIKVENKKIIDISQNDINNILNILCNVDSNVDSLSDMIDNLEIEEDLHDDIYQTEYFAYFDNGYDSN
jgi:hypothetical protein